jgi:low temperature requirement protein LtrA
MDVSDQGGVPPARIRGEQWVTPLELFFDLVFVFALTQVAASSLTTQRGWGC